ncbi:unnamed protein product [Nesidiocoris tenuis]|uniref:EGF-like domain-containing protein n=1 Tax=Nesidiocoris tenuis TaxID=355587 RepID=A0A6H5HKQ7_9HEMI|nr:unnamed protein product [Nesidiocoris tenuis]
MGTGMPRPIRNRINNRGPPKISDLPPLNLDSGLPPALQPPPPPTDRDPPPYPFEKPIIPPEKHIIKPFISGVPLPEQLVPTDQSVLPSSIPASLRPPLRPVRPKPNEKYENKTKIYGDQNRPYPDLTNTPDKPPVKLEPPREPARPFYEGPKQSTKPPLSNPNKNVNLSYAPTPSRTPIVQREEVTNGTTNPPIKQAFNTTQSPSSSNSSSTEKPKISATKVLGVDVSSVVNVVTEQIPDKETEFNVSTTEPGPVKGNSNATTTTSTTSTAGNSTTRMPATSPNNASTETTTRSDFTTVTTPKLGNIANTDRPASSPSLPVSGLTAIPSVTRVRPAIIESSIIEEVPLQDVHKPTKWEQGPMAQKPYKGGGFAPRPGIVLDDPEYKPGGGRPIITAPPKGEIFDVTVSAVHGASPSTGQPVIYPVELEGVNLPGAANGEVSVITKAEDGQHFVSIDGKRTYISLFGSTETAGVKPTSATRPQTKTSAGYAPPVQQGQVSPGPAPGNQQQGNQRPKRPYHRRPQQPPVRIDTCIVGDWSTCDSDQHEVCRTEQGVSSCHCAPGYSRHSHRQPCKRVISVVASVQIDKIYDQKITWSDKLRDVDSQEYLQLEYESARAMESAMSMTPFSDAFMGAKLNNIFTMPGASHKPVFVNMTLQIEESLESKRPQVKQEIQKQLLGAIHRRSNNIGTSPLWAVPANSVSALQADGGTRNRNAPASVPRYLGTCHLAAVRSKRPALALPHTRSRSKTASESERNILRCGLRTEQRPICDDETSGSDSTQHVHHGSFSLLPNMIIYITPEDTKKKFQHLQTTNRPSNPGAYSLLLCNAKTTTKNWTIERLVY